MSETDENDKNETFSSQQEFESLRKTKSNDVVGQGKTEATHATEFLNLPPEVITLVCKHYLPLQDLRKFRYVCLFNQYLYDNVYQIITEYLQKRDSLKLILPDKSEKFVREYNILCKSSLNICLELPSFRPQQFEGQQLMVDLINESHSRVSELTIDADNDVAVLEKILPTLSDLKTLKVCDWIKKFSLISILVRDLIRKNAGLKHMQLHNTDLDAVTSSCCKNLKVLRLVYCTGQICSLIKHSAANLTSLDLRRLTLDSTFPEPLPKLRHLTLRGCNGAVSSLLAAVASSLTEFVFCEMNLDIEVKEPFTKLKVLKIGKLEWNLDWIGFNILDHKLLSTQGTLRDFIPVEQERTIVRNWSIWT